MARWVCNTNVTISTGPTKTALNETSFVRNARLFYMHFFHIRFQFYTLNKI